MPPSARRRRRLWRGCPSVGLLLGLISSAAAQDHRASPAEGPPAPAVEARIDDGLLTLHVDGAPLADVLRAVGAAGGFPVVLRGAFAAPVRDSFAAQPLERAIRRLAEGHALVISYGEAVPGRSARPIAELRVIGQQGRAASGDPAPTEATLAPAAEAADQGAGEPPLDREEFRRRAAAAGTPPPTKDDILLELLLPDQETRLAAVPKVGSLGPHEAAQVLSEVFAAETDPLVRSRALAAAARLQGRPGAALLRQRALGDDDPELRMQALNALAASGEGRVAPVLGRALLRDPEPRVRLTAVQALQRVGGDRARGHIERAIADPDIGKAAEQALATWPEEQPD